MISSEALSFDPETHQYWVDGEKVLSVTQVLKAAGLVDDRWYTIEGIRRPQAEPLIVRASRMAKA